VSTRGALLTLAGTEAFFWVLVRAHAGTRAWGTTAHAVRQRAGLQDVVFWSINIYKLKATRERRTSPQVKDRAGLTWHPRARPLLPSPSLRNLTVDTGGTADLAHICHGVRASVWRGGSGMKGWGRG